MKIGRQSLAFRYGLAIACTLIATWLRLVFDANLTDRVPFVTFFPAIFITALYAGFGPTLLAMALSGLAAAYFFIPPDNALLPSEMAGWTSLILFSSLGLGVALLSEASRRKSSLVQRERERFAVTLASIGDAVIVTDQQAQVTFLNSVAEKLTGWTTEDAQQKPLDTIFRIISEETRQPIANPAVKALQEGRSVGLANHAILIAKDGSERSIDDSAAPIRDRSGRIVGVVLVFRDVSQQRVLQIEQGRLAALVDSSEDAILGQTFDAVATSWNNGAVRMFGFTAEEAIGKPVYETIVPADRKDELLEVLQRVRRGERVDHFQTVRRHKDGRLIPITVRISPILDGDGNVVAASAIDRDISQQRAAERRRNARLAVTQILAQERSIEKAIGGILAAICDALKLDVGCFWQIQSGTEVLRCQQFWQQPSQDCEAFRIATTELACQLDDSLIGQVRKHGRAVWLPDVGNEPGFRRAPQAQECGLHGGFACPITGGDAFLGVIEFFSHQVQQPDNELLETMATIGGQIGQFIERQESEQKLRRSEQELRDFFENAAIGLHWVGPDGTILRANQAELKMLGYSREEYIGRHIADFHADQEAIDDILRWLTAGQQLCDREARMRCKDGSIRDVLIDSNVLWEDGQFIHTRCFTRDITRRKRMERSLRFLAEASNSLSSLVDFKSTLQKVSHLAVPAFADWCVVDMTDSDGVLQRLAVNAADRSKVPLAEELYRNYAPRPDAVRGVAKVFRTGEPEWTAKISDAMLEQIARDEEHLRLLRELGLKSYICVPMKTKEKTLGVMTFVAAESGRRYGPEDLVIAEDLARRAAIAMENAQLYQEVRDADRRKDEFLAMLAHELRNPLAPIRSGLDLLAMDAGGHRNTIHLMQDQVEHVVRLVDDLLDVSRIMRAKIELRKETVQIAALVNQSVQAVRSLVDSHQQELIVSLPNQSIWLNADPVRLVQVLENLVNNASKYTDVGGRITLTVEQQEDQAVIRVQDTGMGIEPELLPHVFDLFTQASRSMDRAQGGLGIGLTLVQRLIEMHGGTVSAHSEGAGRGSTFVVRLPTVEAPAQTRAPVEQLPASASHRILVVDDNEGAAWMLSMLLAKLGDHQIEIAHDGPTALQKAKETHPEIILLDIGLPGMDGHQVAKAIRETPSVNGVLLVALTGYGQEEDRRKSKEAGFDEHLVKPPSLDQMKAVLAHAKLSQ